MKRLFFTSVVIVWGPALGICAEPDAREASEHAIREAVSSYVAAFNKGDAKALSAMWTPQAVYTNPLSGEQVVGREAIEQQFAKIFAEAKGVKLEANTESVQFISPGVALEQGTAKVTRPDEEGEESRYSAVYVKIDDAWLLDRVTEEDVVETPSHYEQLKPLAWLIGTWVDQDDSATVVVDCSWARNENFLVRSFTIQIGDSIEMAGMQLIGWDPSAKQIRSWVFDSDGGFGHGTWSNKGDLWYVQQSGVLPDGRSASSMNIIKYLDDNSCTLQSINRTVDGELLPNVQEVLLTKESSEQ